MKKAITATLIASLVLTPAAFAANSTGKTTPTKPPILTPAPQFSHLKVYAAQLANDDFSKAMLHTAKQMNAYEFELKPSDFGTEKWPQYVTAIYIQATDINYCVSTFYADGNLKQSIVFNTEAVEKMIQEANEKNEALRKEALEKPNKTQLANYKAVYQAPWQLIDEKTLIERKLLTEKVLKADEAAPDMDLTQSYKLYKKGKNYVLVMTNGSTGALVGTASNDLKTLDDLVGKVVEQNNLLLK